jgi:Right handed beta helix region/PKD domain
MLLAVAGAVGFGLPSATAEASGSATATFYVNNAASVGCSDATTDSAVTPYCTIQQAVDAATSPGDAVIVSSGIYTPFTVSSSGTAASPITIESNDPKYSDYAHMPTVSEPPGSAAGIALNGSSYVTVRGFGVEDDTTASSAATVSGATHDVFDGNNFNDVNSLLGNPLVELGSDTSYITLSRDDLHANGSGGQVGVLGGSNDVITTNALDGIDPGVVLSGTTSVDVTSNTLLNSCGGAIKVTHGSRSTSIENNLVEQLNGESQCDPTPQTEVALFVDGTSTSSTTADYNDLSTGDTEIPDPYSWGGTPYATAAAFELASSQGAHDSNVYPAPTINSANSDAPGELATDIFGNPRVDDPIVPHTGAGAYDYYDRGATQTEDQISRTTAVNWPTTAPVGATATYALTVKDAFGYTITGCTYDFGDSTAPVSVAPTAGGGCTTQRAYTATGNYQILLTISVSSGNSLTLGVALVQVDPVAPFIPTISASSDGALGLNGVARGTDDWNITGCTVDFGDGTAVVSMPYNPFCDFSHQYKTAGTRTINVKLTDSGGNQTSISQAFATSGSYFTPVAPTRILDTRTGTGVTAAGPVAPGGVVKLKVAGVNGLPQVGVKAVALNVTATQGTKMGYITAYADGSTLPGTSNVDFRADQNVANTVIAAVGLDGYVDLANQSAGSTHFVADLEGYYSPDASSGYNAIAPARILDTRKTTPIAAGQTVRLNMGSYKGISATMLNLTVVDATGNGYITASPDLGTIPATSNVNYLTGQTVSNEAVVQVGADGYVDFTNRGTGAADLIVDLSGYFSTGSGESFTPVAPTRILDTRDYLGYDGDIVDPHESLEVSSVGDCPGVVCGINPVAVSLNVTVTQPTANGYITAYPVGLKAIPNTSAFDFRAGQQIQNAVTVELGSQATAFFLYSGSSGSTELIADISGYYGG